MTSAADPILAQGGGYGPPGGYGGPPPGAPPGGYGPPGGPGGYGPPGGYGGGAGGYGPPGGPVPPYGAPLPPQGGAPFGQPAGGPRPDLKKQATTWLIVSIALFVVCGCCFSLSGTAFCYMAMQAVDAGNIEDAQSKLKWGKILTLAGFGVGVIVSVILFAIYAAEILAAIGSVH